MRHLAILAAMGSQRCALRDAEAMLFVDHDQSEVVEGDRVAEQRMRADHEIDPAVG